MRFKQIAAVMVGAALVFGSLPYSALAKDSENTDIQKGKYETKDEAIYSNLTANGSLKNMYVVNTFHVKKTGEIVDHGDYTDVRNLTNLTDIEQDDNDVRFQAEEGNDDFYYQGYLENHPLPWDIEITYLLDGEKVDPSALAGKDGSLEIQIETSANEKVDKTFFENYMMQIALTLDPSIFADIQAPDGTKAKEGKNTNLTFTAMPDEEAAFIVSADVTDFEMDPINISATPASMSIDDPDLGDMKSDMKSLSDAIKEIHGGVGDLRDGISDLSDGASELSDGSGSYLNGINQLDQSSGELVNGSAQMSDALQQISDGMQGTPDESLDFSEFEQLPDGIRALANGLNETAGGLDELRDNYDIAYSNLDDAIEEIPDGDITEEQIGELLNSDVDQETVNQLIDSYESNQKIKGTYESVKEAFDAVTVTLNDVSGSIQEMAEEANSMATEIENGLNDMDGMDDLEGLEDLQSGLSELASQYQSFHQGLVGYTDGVSDLASNYQDIDKGIGGLAEGTDSLADGAGDLQEGTEELEEETSDMPDEIQSEVDKMMDEFDASDFNPISFVSDKNKDVDIVQFVLQTESIELEEPDTTEDTDEEEDKGFWQRFLDLFR